MNYKKVMINTLKTPLLLFTWVCFMACIMGCNTSNETLTVATYTYATNNRIENIKPFSQAIKKLLDQPTETKSYPGVTELLEAIKEGEVDIAFINTLGYLLLAIDNEVAVPVAALEVDPSFIDNYKSVIIARKDRDLKGPEDLNNERSSLSFTFVSETSTSGNLVPRLFLSSLGISSPEKDFKNITYGGDHESTFRKLLDNETDACALGSATFFSMTQKDSSIMKEVDLLWISSEIPLGPVLLSEKLPSAKRKRISDFLLTLDSTDPTAFNGIKGGWSEARHATRFIPISDKYYNSLRHYGQNSADLLPILSPGPAQKN